MSSHNLLLISDDGSVLSGLATSSEEQAWVCYRVSWIFGSFLNIALICHPALHRGNIKQMFDNLVFVPLPMFSELLR